VLNTIRRCFRENKVLYTSHARKEMRGEEQEEIRENSDVILVPIKVLVCEECGERYYDRTTMKRLEEIEQSIKEKRMPLQKVGRVLRVS